MSKEMRKYIDTFRERLIKESKKTNPCPPSPNLLVRAILKFSSRK